MTEETRTIKKYPNRRLYDTAISSYITLDDIKELVLNHVEFRVVDAKTQEDLTHATLLQIISEQEGAGAPIFTTQILQQLIRYYGNSMQGVVSQFLEQSMTSFLSQQQQMTEQVNKLLEPTPFKMVGELAQRNLKMWQDLQRNFVVKSPFGQKPEETGQGDASQSGADVPRADKKK